MAVPKENVEIVREMCRAYASRDWEAAQRPLHPDILWDMSTYGQWPENEVFRGRQGVLEFFRRFLGTWEEYHAEFDDFVAADSDVVVTVRDRGRGKGSGVLVEREWAQVWTVEGGRVVRFRPFERRADALRAVGLLD